MDSQPWHWNEEIVEKFIRALFVVGTDSNVEFAREMKSVKTAHNVKAYKLKFLKDHPDWKTEFRHLDTSADLETTDVEKEVAMEEEEVTLETGTPMIETQAEEIAMEVEVTEVDEPTTIIKEAEIRSEELPPATE